MEKSIGEKINEDLHIIRDEYRKLCGLDETPHWGECIYCGEQTENQVTWNSNDPKIHGTSEFICEDCRENEL